MMDKAGTIFISPGKKISAETLMKVCDWVTQSRKAADKYQINYQSGACILPFYGEYFIHQQI